MTTTEQIITLLPGGFAADWTMTFVDSETDEEYTTDGADDVDATRPEAAAYWAEVAEAQAEALEHEAKARAALEAGDLGIALAAIREAAECEHPEGAGGTYDRIMRALIEAAIAKRHDELYIIVSRHAGAVEFIHREMPETKSAPVLASATIADVAGKIVIGNVPMNLAQHALEVHAVEFSGPPPRGTELSLSDMDAAGAKLTEYTVIGPEDRSTKGARDTYLVDRSYAYARPGTEPAGTYLKEK